MKLIILGSIKVSAIDRNMKLTHGSKDLIEEVDIITLNTIYWRITVKISVIN